MALLIDIKSPEWIKDEDLQTQLLTLDPNADIRCASNPGKLEDIDMLTVNRYKKGEALRYPNLKLVQKTGAGVESIMSDETLPESVQIARLRTDISGEEMAEYALAYVLQEQRQIRQYQTDQNKHTWAPYAPRRASETRVAVLGLGRIGQLITSRFINNGFQVMGWSRSPKAITRVDCYSGDAAFKTVLGLADYVVSVLPSTPETTHLFNQDTFAMMKPSAFIINVGRGTLIDEEALIQSLDNNHLAGAVLDVMEIEPLSVDSPLWTHDKVILTPHVSGWHLGDATADIAENYRRLSTGESLLNRVDRQVGY